MDFAINALTGGQFEELANTFSNNSIAEKFLRQHAEILDGLEGLGSATVTKDRDCAKTRSAPRTSAQCSSWRVFLPSNAVLHGRGLGSGSIRRPSRLAMSLCRSVDAYVVRVFRDDVDAADYRCLHFYQDACPARVTWGAPTDDRRRGSDSELRNAVWDVRARELRVVVTS